MSYFSPVFYLQAKHHPLTTFSNFLIFKFSLPQLPQIHSCNLCIQLIMNQHIK